MNLARYIGNGKVEIVDETVPTCPSGGILVKVEACGLCSGELMSWYMDQKIPHVLGHELAGVVVDSQDERFPVGSRVFPHHHAPCMQCSFCEKELYVHCSTWRKTKLIPGGMAEFCAVSADNLADTWRVDDLDPREAALTEPLACVVKSFRQAGSIHGPVLVVGLGVMGLLHLLALKGEDTAVAVDLNPDRVAHAQSLGLQACLPSDLREDKFRTIFVCPGSQSAFDYAIELASPGATIVMFAPVPPGTDLVVPQKAYFQDVTVTHAYSCGPNDTEAALSWIREGRVRAEDVVSNFVRLDDLPEAYELMKAGKILKAMVIF